MSPIGDSFMYIETNGILFEPKVFVCFEPTDKGQTTNITF